jgi:hypothetical protein
MKFLNFFCLSGSFCPPGSESGSTDPIESGYNSDLDPQPCLHHLLHGDVVEAALLHHLPSEGEQISGDVWHCCQMAEFWAAGLKNGSVKLLAA